MIKKETFDEVVDKVKTEREYQDDCVTEFYKRHNKTDATDCSRPIAAEIMMMDVYLNDAKYAWTHVANDEEALECIRKIVAIGIRCLQYHGCPERGLDCDYVV